MAVRKYLSLLVLALTLVGFAAHTWAGTASLSLAATKEHPSASGTGSLSEQSLSIQAQGLRPNAVYTVWFVNTKPSKHETGAGSAPYMFKTDSNGRGTYQASLSESPAGKWEMLMIVLHPDGDPKNMKSMVGALSAKIPDRF
jgi:hypothetical protein